MRDQLLLLFTACALSVPVALAQEESDESRAIKKIELLGGGIERDESLPNRPVTAIWFAHESRFNDKYIHLLTAFTQLKSLDLIGSRITEAGCEKLAKLKMLEELALPNMDISDKQVEQLQKMASLKSLVLWDQTIGTSRREEIQAALPGIRVSYGSFAGVGSTSSNGRWITAKTDRKQMTVGLKASQDGSVPRHTMIEMPGLAIQLEPTQLVISGRPSVEIPEGTKDLEIFDRRGIVSILANGKVICRFKTGPNPDAAGSAKVGGEK